MNIILYSTKPCAVKIEQTTFNLCPLNPVLITEPTPNCILEFFPPAPFCGAVCCISQPFLNKNVQIIDLYGDIIIIPTFVLSRNLPFEKHRQSTHNFFGVQTTFSLVTDGVAKLIIATPYQSEQIDLPFIATDFTIYPCNEKPLFVIEIFARKKVVIVFDLQNFCTLFKGVCDSFELDKNLSLTTSYCDICKHTVTNVWEITDSVKLLCKKVTAKQKQFLPEVLPFAFLEEVRVGGDYSQFLSNALKPNANLCPQFLGEFKHVLPPILPLQNDKLILTYQKTAKFFSCTISHGKIADFNVT